MLSVYPLLAKASLYLGAKLWKIDSVAERLEILSEIFLNKFLYDYLAVVR